MFTAIVREAILTFKQTVVGANPWVIHRSKEVYGEDVEDFRPDRWLKEDTGDMRMFCVDGNVDCADSDRPFLLHVWFGR